MARRFQGYSLVDGGRLHFDESEPRITGFLILGGRKYKVDWVWGYSSWSLCIAHLSVTDFNEIPMPDKDDLPEEFLSWYAQTWAGRTVEFGEVSDVPSATGDETGYFEQFHPDQSGFAGDIAEDGSYIEWFSFHNARCVIEGFEFRDVE